MDRFRFSHQRPLVQNLAPDWGAGPSPSHLPSGLSGKRGSWKCSLGCGCTKSGNSDGTYVRWLWDHRYHLARAIREAS